MTPKAEDTVAAAGKRPLFTRFEVFTDLEAAAAAWLKIETPDAVLTPFQRLDWIRAWQTHVGARHGVSPLIVVGYENDEPIMLLPLGTSRTGFLLTAHFLGGTHSSFNAPIWARHASQAATEADIGQIFSCLSGIRPRIDVLSLMNQPASWNGVANHLLRRHRQEAPSDVWSGDVHSGRQPALPTRLRPKQRKMSAIGDVSYWQPTTKTEIDSVLDAFFAQKALRFRAQGIPDVFSDPEVQNFLRDASSVHGDAKPAIELFAMSVGSAIAAVYGGSLSGKRFSFTLNSITSEAPQRFSPGLLLFANVLPMLAARGIETVDLGVGEDVYKRSFCPEVEALADTFIALSFVGILPAALMSMQRGARRTIKRSPALFGAVRALRRLKGMIAGAAMSRSGRRASSDPLPEND